MAYPDKYYVREGNWCKCEQSCNWSNGLMNSGVSVHDCEAVGHNQWKPLGRSWELRTGGTIQSSGHPWFLVSGQSTVTRGGDLEPLITMVQAHWELAWNSRQKIFVVAQVATYEPATTHAQIDGYCHFPTHEFETMQMGIYGAEFIDIDG